MFFSAADMFSSQLVQGEARRKEVRSTSPNNQPTEFGFQHEPSIFCKIRCQYQCFGLCAFGFQLKCTLLLPFGIQYVNLFMCSAGFYSFCIGLGYESYEFQPEPQKLCTDDVLTDNLWWKPPNLYVSRCSSFLAVLFTTGLYSLYWHSSDCIKFVNAFKRTASRPVSSRQFPDEIDPPNIPKDGGRLRASVSLIVSKNSMVDDGGKWLRVVAIWCYLWIECVMNALECYKFWT